MVKGRGINIVLNLLSVAALFSMVLNIWSDYQSAKARDVFAIVWNHLKVGGQIAIQMPSNHNHPSHRLIRELASKAPFAEALQGWQRISPVLGIEAYADLFYRLGAKQITVLEKIYPHILPTARDLMEWVKGTALLPYLERLSLPLQEEFLRRYRQEITASFPATPVFYGFRRILIHAHKA